VIDQQLHLRQIRATGDVVMFILSEILFMVISLLVFISSSLCRSFFMLWLFL